MAKDIEEIKSDIKERIESLREKRRFKQSKFLRDRDVLQAIFDTESNQIIDEIDYLEKLIKD